MSQAIFNNINPSTTSGNQLAVLLTDFKNAVVSGFSGTTRPSQLLPGGYWIDITNDLTGFWEFKIYDGFQDITVFSLNKNTGAASISSADTLFKVSRTSDDSVGPILRLLKERISGLKQTLAGDTLGEVQFHGTRDDSVGTLQARIKSISQNNVSAVQQGAYLAFEVTTLNGASVAEVMRIIDGKVGIGTNAPSEALHVIGNARFAKNSDDAVGPIVKLRKRRITSSGQVLNNDVIGSVDFISADEAGADVESASIEVTARETQSTAAQGSKIVLKNKKLGQVVYTNQIEIEEDVKVKTKLNAQEGMEVTGDSLITGNETVTGLSTVGSQVVSGTQTVNGTSTLNGTVNITGNLNVTGTTTTVNSANLEVTDPNISVNKGGNQSTANSAKSGFKVEMSDATHAQIGYDSTKNSKFVIGEIGSEKEIADVSSVQSFTNKALVSPSRLDPKQDTFSALVTYALTAINGELVHATDNKRVYYVKDGLLEYLPGLNFVVPSIAISVLNIDWSLGTVFYKDVAANSTFTFSNLIDGKVISVVIRNTSVANITLTLPAGIFRDTTIDLVVEPSKENVYTFIRSNSKTYASFVSKLTNA